MNKELNGLTVLNYQQEIIFLRILLPYTTGILLFYPFTGLNAMSYCLYSGWFLLILLLALNILYTRIRAYKFKTLTGLAFSTFWMVFGGYCCMLKHELIQPSHFSHEKSEYLKINIVDEPQQKKKVLTFRASVNKSFKQTDSSSSQTSFQSTITTGKLIVSIPVKVNEYLKLQYGDELLIKAKIKTIAPPSDPSDFDYRFWLATQNIYHGAFLRQHEVLKLRSTNEASIQHFAVRLRAEHVAFFRSILKDDDSFAFASTLILGYKSDLNKEIMDTYSKTGTIHALSVSGMHVGIVYVVLNWLLSLMDRRRWTHVIKIILILGFIWFYALLTGLSPSVLRSAIMLSVYILAKSLNRHTNSYNVIAFAAFCLLLYNPFLIWDIGFQLSFIAVLGLIWLQPLVMNWFSFRQLWLRKLWSSIAISLAAQTITFPLSIYYFHQFPVYFLISNLFIILPIALLMYTGILILVFRIAALGPLFDYMIKFTNRGLTLISELPMGSISGIYFSKTELIFLYCAMFAFIFALTYYRKRLLFIGLVFYLVFQSMLTLDHFKIWKGRHADFFQTKWSPIGL
ncbi:MAG: ComEC/Rec2 family competence protein [Bacteroidota bacterium]